MKKFIYLILVFLVFNSCVLAQNNDTKGIVETQSCLFNITTTPVHYDQRFNTNSGFYNIISSIYYKMPAAENFIQLQSLYKVSHPLKNNFQILSQVRLSYLSYEFLQNIGYYNYNGSTSFYTQRILDEAIGFGGGVGLGKTYYLSKNKKWSLVPQLLGYLDFNIINKNLTQYYSYDNFYFGKLNQVNIGAQLNLTVNYKISKRLGFSLSFERLGNLFHKNELFLDDKSRDNSNFGFSLFKFPSQLFLGIVYTR